MRVIPKDPNSNIDIKFICPGDQEEFIYILNDLLSKAMKGECKYKTIIFDSASYWMNVVLLQTMEDQTLEAEVFKQKRKLIDSVRTDEATYGALPSHMNRIFVLMKKITQHGILCIVIAQGMESPKWNRDLSVCPNFVGKKIHGDLKSHFDLIGLVIPKVDDDNNSVYPSMITFKTPADGSYVAKWTGKHVKNPTGTFDFSKFVPEGKGRFVLIYSAEAGEGKSTGCIGSAPQPILDIFVEDRDPNTSLEALQ